MIAAILILIVVMSLCSALPADGPVSSASSSTNSPLSHCGPKLQALLTHPTLAPFFANFAPLKPAISEFKATVLCLNEVSQSWETFSPILRANDIIFGIQLPTIFDMEPYEELELLQDAIKKISRSRDNTLRIGIFEAGRGDPGIRHRIVQTLSALDKLYIFSPITDLNDLLASTSFKHLEFVSPVDPLSSAVFATLSQLPLESLEMKIGQEGPLYHDRLPLVPSLKSLRVSSEKVYSALVLYPYLEALRIDAHGGEFLYPLLIPRPRLKKLEIYDLGIPPDDVDGIASALTTQMNYLTHLKLDFIQSALQVDYILDQFLSNNTVIESFDLDLSISSPSIWMALRSGHTLKKLRVSYIPCTQSTSDLGNSLLFLRELKEFEVEFRGDALHWFDVLKSIKILLIDLFHLPHLRSISFKARVSISEPKQQIIRAFCEELWHHIAQISSRIKRDELVINGVPISTGDYNACIAIDEVASPELLMIGNS